MVSTQFQCGWIQSAEAHFHGLALISTLVAASAGRWRIKWAWRPNYLFSHSGDSFEIELEHDGLMWVGVRARLLSGLFLFRMIEGLGSAGLSMSRSCLSCYWKQNKTKKRPTNLSKKHNPKDPLILLPWRDIFSPFWMRGKSCLGEFKWDPCQPYAGRIDAVTLKGWDAAAHFRFCWIIQQGAESR